MNTQFIKKILSKTLVPVELLWEGVYRSRRLAYDYGFFHQNVFKVPVISIGNLTFGGGGKTPLTLWLAQYYESLGLKVVILMRGYKGKLEHKSGILRAGKRLGHNPFDYGDEALLLARRLNNASIIIGKNRCENLNHYFATEKPDIVLLDDGYQHLNIYRSLNIVLFDSLIPLDYYKVAPRGYLREGFWALKDADLIVFTRSDQAPQEQVTKLRNQLSKYVAPHTPFLNVTYEPTGLLDPNFNRVKDISGLKDQKVILLAGVASPRSFYELVESLGAEVLDRITFPDHHLFKSEEILPLVERAKANDALIITTEKDMVKLRRIYEGEHLVFLEINVHFQGGQKLIKTTLDKLVENTL